MLIKSNTRKINEFVAVFQPFEATTVLALMIYLRSETFENSEILNNYYVMKTAEVLEIEHQELTDDGGPTRFLLLRVY